MIESSTPRWWRLDPKSQVELRWGPSPDDDGAVEQFSGGEPHRAVLRERCISLRPYKDDYFGGATQRVYGAWRTFDLLPYRTGDLGEFHGRTTLVDGVPMIDVFALDAPTVGSWQPTPTDTEGGSTDE